MQRIAVAATGAQSLAAGLAVADEGGTAVDAALAAAFVALVTEPGIVSLGGGAFVSVWPADGDPVVVDGNVAMPGLGGDPARLGGGLREITTEYGGGVTLHAGLGSVAVPGAMAAFGVAHERWAALPWARLVSPAAAAARDHPMSGAASRYLGYVADSLFGEDPEAHAIVTTADGRVPARGERCANALLGNTLDELAVEGPDLFTTGRVGRALVELCQGAEGLVTGADLASYAAVVRPAHRLTAGDWEFAINPPPSVGGAMLAVMLGELARRGDWTWADVIDVQGTVLGYRSAVHDLSPDLEADGTDLLAQTRHGLGGLRGSSSTAHVSAVDAAGNACAVTMSSGYGAGLSIPGTGILLNNALGEVELNPRGLHALEPGTRLMSNMAPTTGRTADGRVLAIGSPGADRITTALLQVLAHGALRGASLPAAIDHPRLHVRVDETGRPVQIDHEADPELTAAVLATGLPSREYAEPDMYFGGVGAAYRSAAGQLEAAGDHRRHAAVGVA